MHGPDVESIIHRSATGVDDVETRRRNPMDTGKEVRIDSGNLRGPCLIGGKVAYVEQGGEKKSVTGTAGGGRPATAILVFVVCLAVFNIYHLSYLKRTDVFRTDGDEVQYIATAQGLVEYHDISPLKVYERREYRAYYGGYTELPLVRAKGGRLVCSNTRFPFLLVPGYWAAGYHGAAETMILLSSLAAMFLFLSLRKLISEWIALAATLVFFLTYPMLIYSRLVYPETVAVFFVSVALWASLRLREGAGWGYAAVSGISAALLFQAHLKFAVLSAALLFLLLVASRHRSRDLLAWGVPVVVSAAALFALMYHLFGSDVIHGLTASVSPGDILGGTPFWGIFGLYLDRAWGLFIFAPLYLAFVPGVPVAKNRRDLLSWWTFIPVCIVLFTLVVGFFGQWHGGVSPVPRYLVPLIPLFVMCAALAAARNKSRVVLVVMLGLLVDQLILTAAILVHPMNAFAVHGSKNALIPSILGDNGFSRFLVNLFPLFHPVTFWSGILPLVLWVAALLGVSIYMRSRVMDPLMAGRLENL